MRISKLRFVVIIMCTQILIEVCDNLQSIYIADKNLILLYLCFSGAHSLKELEVMIFMTDCDSMIIRSLGFDYYDNFELIFITSSSLIIVASVDY